MASHVQIDSLANHRQYLEPLAKWYHQAFSHLTGDLTLEQRQKNLESHIHSDTLPFSFVAFNRQRLLGGLCLVEHDIESCPWYTPWLSRIYVDESSRGQSVANRLIDHASGHIRGLGFQNLYLLTEHQQIFFTAMGFAEIDSADLNGFEMSIMVMKIS